MEDKFELKIEYQDTNGNIYRHELVTGDFRVLEMFIEGISENFDASAEKGVF